MSETKTTRPSNNDFICQDCAVKYCRNKNIEREATWHKDDCVFCGCWQPVTQIRDYGGLR